MIGTNEIRLNEATMKQVVQRWVNTEFPYMKPEVLGVKPDIGSGFLITLGEKKEDKA